MCEGWEGYQPFCTTYNCSEPVEPLYSGHIGTNESVLNIEAWGELWTQSSIMMITLSHTIFCKLAEQRKEVPPQKGNLSIIRPIAKWLVSQCNVRLLTRILWPPLNFGSLGKLLTLVPTEQASNFTVLLNEEASNFGVPPNEHTAFVFHSSLNKQATFCSTVVPMNCPQWLPCLLIAQCS